MEKQIEILMKLARINMVDAEQRKNSCGALMYCKGKLDSFEYAYALMKGFDLAGLLTDEATNAEFIAMHKRCDELIVNCDSYIVLPKVTR